MKNLMKLRKRPKSRDEQDVFVAEGLKMFLEAPQDRIIKTFVSESFWEKKEYHRFFRTSEPEVVEDQVFKTVSDTQSPQGILSIVKQYHYTLSSLLECEKPHILILENIQDPGNLGTMLRTGEGAGISGIIISSDSVDIYNPKTIRSTMGSIYRVPFFYSNDMDALLLELKKHHIMTYAAHLEGDNPYEEEDYRNGTAFFIGNEGNGLSENLSSKADTWIRIPMEGKVESLNAAAAASILMYEAYRQRR